MSLVAPVTDTTLSTLVPGGVPSINSHPTQAVSPSPQVSTQTTSHPAPYHVLIAGYTELNKLPQLKKFPNIDTAIKAALQLATSGHELSQEQGKPQHHLPVLLEPFILSSRSRSLPLQLQGIAYLTKAINHGHLTLDALRPRMFANEVKLSDTVITAITDAFQGLPTDPKLQINILNGLMAASSALNLHREHLISVVRTLYNIYLYSGETCSQTLAQGAMKQILRGVFAKIDAQISPNQNEVADPQPNIKESSQDDLGLEDELTTWNITMPPKPFTDIHHSSKNGNRTSEDKRNSNQFENDGYGDNKEEPLVARLTMDRESGATEGMQLAEFVEQILYDGGCDEDVLDGFLLLRSLCKLAGKPYNDYQSLVTRSVTLRSKLLAQFLLMLLLDEFPRVIEQTRLGVLVGEEDVPNPQFRMVKFSTLIKPYIVPFLSQSLISEVPKVSELSLAIFDVLLTKLWRPFQWEIEMWLREIIIPMLDKKPHSDFLRTKHLILTIVISKLCSNPTLLHQLHKSHDLAPEGPMKSKLVYQLVSSMCKLITQLTMEEEDPVLHWDELTPFQVTAVALDRSELIKLPDFTTDQFNLTFMTSSFFPRRTFTQLVLQQRCLVCLRHYIDSISSLATSPNSTTNKSDSASTKNVSTDDLTGLELFNVDPLLGVKSLVELGDISEDAPGTIAQFLINKGPSEVNGLTLGQYLGVTPLVMVQYMKHFDFNDQTIVQALRHLLCSFRLPRIGLDGILLQFSVQYKLNNNKHPLMADAIYQLSYLSLLIHINLHCPNLINLPLDKQQFITQFGHPQINGELSSIYDEIKALRLPIKEDAKPITSEKGSLVNQLYDLTNEELDLSITSLELHLSQLLLNHRSTNFQLMVQPGRQTKECQLMLETLWMPYLLASSELIKKHHNQRIIGLSLFNLRHTIQLAGQLSSELAYQSLLGILCNVGTIGAIKDLNGRTLSTVITLLDTVNESISQPHRLRFFKDRWGELLSILDRLSCLQYLPYYSARMVGDDRILTAYTTDHRSFDTKTSHTVAQDEVTTNTQRLLIATDRVFAQTIFLPLGDLLPLIDELSDLINLQLATHTNKFPEDLERAPQLFLLRRSLEVVMLNLPHRSYYEWELIWDKLCILINAITLSENSIKLAAYIIDWITNQLIPSYLQHIALHQPALLKLASVSKLFQPIIVLFGRPVFQIEILSQLEELLTKHSDILADLGSVGWKSVLLLLVNDNHIQQDVQIKRWGLIIKLLHHDSLLTKKDGLLDNWEMLLDGLLVNYYNGCTHIELTQEIRMILDTVTPQLLSKNEDFGWCRVLNKLVGLAFPDSYHNQPGSTVANGVDLVLDYLSGLASVLSREAWRSIINDVVLVHLARSSISQIEDSDGEEGVNQFYYRFLSKLIEIKCDLPSVQLTYGQLCHLMVNYQIHGTQNLAKFSGELLSQLIQKDTASLFPPEEYEAGVETLIEELDSCLNKALDDITITTSDDENVKLRVARGGQLGDRLVVLIGEYLVKLPDNGGDELPDWLNDKSLGRLVNLILSVYRRLGQNELKKIITGRDQKLCQALFQLEMSTLNWLFKVSHYYQRAPTRLDQYNDSYQFSIDLCKDILQRFNLESKMDECLSHPSNSSGSVALKKQRESWRFRLAAQEQFLLLQTIPFLMELPDHEFQSKIPQFSRDVIDLLLIPMSAELRYKLGDLVMRIHCQFIQPNSKVKGIEAKQKVDSESENDNECYIGLELGLNGAEADTVDDDDVFDVSINRVSTQDLQDKSTVATTEIGLPGKSNEVDPFDNGNDSNTLEEPSPSDSNPSPKSTSAHNSKKKGKSSKAKNRN